jgi:hypothetical protein
LFHASDKPAGNPMPGRNKNEDFSWIKIIIRWRGKLLISSAFIVWRSQRVERYRSAFPSAIFFQLFFNCVDLLRFVCFFNMKLWPTFGNFLSRDLHILRLLMVRDGSRRSHFGSVAMGRISWLELLIIELMR